MIVFTYMYDPCLVYCDNGPLLCVSESRFSTYTGGQVLDDWIEIIFQCESQHEFMFSRLREKEHQT